MKTLYKKAYCSLLVLGFLILNVNGQLPKTGLYFNAHQFNVDKRTSLVLNNGEPYSLRDHSDFTLEFDFYIRNEPIKFGYFFRIITNKDENVDLVITNPNNLFLVINNRDVQLASSPVVEKWGKCHIIFNKKENKITLNFDGEVIECPYDLSTTHTLLVNFGCCDFKGFVPDVAPIILKDVTVGMNGRPVHCWALGKHGSDVVYDDLQLRPALVQNPLWIKDFGILWHKEAELQTALYPQVAFDSIQNRVIVLNLDSYTTYSLATGRLQTIPISGSVPHNTDSNQLLFDAIHQSLISYSIEEKRINVFDETLSTWSAVSSQYARGSTHAHHNSYISPLDSMLYLFGGYGFYVYKSDLFKVDLSHGFSWTTSDLSHTIIPRYLAAMGGNSTGDKLYVFGGRGAEMGRQELGSRNFSDLYEIDLRTMKVKLLYDLTTKHKKEDDNVYSNNLLIDEGDSCFYVLGYSNKANSSISLEKHSLLRPEVEFLANAIPFYFQDIISLCDLYYSPRLSKLIAIVASSADGSSANLSIYSLDYPPLKKEDVLQTVSSMQFAFQFLLLFSIILLLIIVFFLYGWLTKKKRFPGATIKDQPSLKEVKGPDMEKAYYSETEKSIMFFGGFQVFDKEGKNLTGEFTPTLKYMLVLIILYTLNNKKGISSSKLQELLWFDKSEEAARNNRNVNLRKLRVLLQDVGAIEITNENGYWTIAIPSSVFSDYRESLQLIGKIQSSDQVEIEDILRLVELLSLGPMLPNIQLEWVDSFKNDFSSAVIDVLLYYLSNQSNPYLDRLDIQLKVADTIMKFDPINEEAISIKCNTLYKMGKKGLAKTAFDHFSKEYKTLLGENYQGSLKAFLEKK